MSNEAIRGQPTALDLLRRQVLARPGKEAIIYVRDHEDPDGRDILTYAALDAEARRIAAGIQEHCSQGDRVLLMHSPGLPFVAALVGSLYAGTVAVPSPIPGQSSYQRRRARGIVTDARAQLALTDSGTADEAGQWAADEGLPLRVAVTDRRGFGDRARWREPEATADDLAVLQYTSGATGDPKGVMVDHRSLLCNAEAQARALALTEHTIVGGWIPLYHDMGLMGMLLPSLFRGSTVVLMSPVAFLMRPHRWLAMIDRYRIALSAAPDFAYELCTRRITDQQAARLNLSDWRLAADGSEPIRAGTLRAFTERFAGAGLRRDAMVPCYGMAEATLFVSAASGRPPLILQADAEALDQHLVRPSHPGSQVRELVACGQVADYDLRIVDPATLLVLPEGSVGEIWLRGPSVAAGYWQRPAETEETFRARTADGDGPFLRTGDLGAVVDGELYITGRRKDLIIIHGRNLYPQDIEHEVRLHHPELGSLAGAAFTVAVPQEELVLMHEVRGLLSGDLLRDIAIGLRSTVLREFGVHAAAVVLLRPGAVLKTTSGKVQRAEMRRLFLAGALVPVHQDLTAPLLAAVRQA